MLNDIDCYKKEGMEPAVAVNEYAAPSFTLADDIPMNNRLKNKITSALLLYGASMYCYADGASPAAPASSCMEVEINGYRALPYDCYQQLMSPPAVPRAAGTPLTRFDADISQRQPNQIGLYSLSTLKNRMGNNLGKSALPQRPAKK